MNASINNLSKSIIFILLTLFASQAWTAIKTDEDLSIFSGRLSKVNRLASLVRVRVRFKNMKFLKKKDKVVFWSDFKSKNRCYSYVVSKSSEYLLLRIPNYARCLQKIGFTAGSFLYFQSDDLKTSLEVGHELLSILVKKRLALQAKLNRNKKELEIHIEKVDGVNKRFQVLREKLELEWEQELSALEKDRAETLKDRSFTQSKLDQTDLNLEKYRIYDRNLEVDRWSLDARRYIKK